MTTRTCRRENTMSHHEHPGPEAWVGQAPVHRWEADVTLGVGESLPTQVVIFSNHLAAHLDWEEWDWFIIDRRDGRQINLAPFHNDEMGYLTLTCYHLKSMDDQGARMRDINRATRAASDDLRRGEDDPKINSFLADFSVVAVELIERDIR